MAEKQKLAYFEGEKIFAATYPEDYKQSKSRKLTTPSGYKKQMNFYQTDEKKDDFPYVEFKATYEQARGYIGSGFELKEIPEFTKVLHPEMEKPVEPDEQDADLAALRKSLADQEEE